MKPISREQLVLLVLALANGRPMSRTRFQKSIYEIQEELPASLLSSKFPYRASNFGAYTEVPYQVAVEYAGEGLVGLGELAERDNYPSDYAATQLGIQVGRSYGSDFPDDVLTWMQFTVNRWLENAVNDSLERVYDRYPDSAVNSKVVRDRRGKIVRHFPNTSSDTLYREDSGVPHTPPHNAINMIGAATELPKASIAKLLNVPVELLTSWQQGDKVPKDVQTHILAVADVLTRARRLHPRASQLRLWLTSPVAPNGQTPEELLLAGQYDRARFYAVTQPSDNLVTPSDWSRDPIPDIFSEGAENLRGASLDDAEDDLLSSKDRHKSIW